MKEDTQLARWLAGEMNENELEALKNTPRYETLVRIKENFEKINRPHFESDTMLKGILAKEKTPVKVIPLYKKYWLQTAAAAVVLLLGLGLLFSRHDEQVAGNAETLAFTLPDRSAVVLNAGSQSTYKDWNWSADRTVELNGEAYFKVAKGQKFTVNTPLGKVSVLGTQFNVKARDNRFDVVCYEGKVRVEYNGKATILTPHQGLTVENGTANNGVITVATTEPNWLKGELVFVSEKLPAVLAEIERKYDVEFKTDITSKKTFSGSLPGNDIDGVIKTLSRLYHLEADKQGKTILLKPINAKK